MTHELKYENGKKEYVSISADLTDLYVHHSKVALDVLAMTHIKNLKFSEDEKKGLAHNISLVIEHLTVLVNFRKEIKKYEDKNVVDKELDMWEENNAKIRYNYYVKTIKEYRENELFSENMDALCKYDERLRDYFFEERNNKLMKKLKDAVNMNLEDITSNLRRN